MIKPLTGVRELARKTSRQDDKYIAYILAVMSVEDYNKANIENEEATYLAYRFFSERGLFTAVRNGKPSGYDDYYSWLGFLKGFKNPYLAYIAAKSLTYRG